jgi:uncharacterized membrane protein
MNAFFLLLRVTHVITGMFWVGASLFLTFFLYPSVRDAGPAAGLVMRGIIGRKYPAVAFGMGLLTLISGFSMYYLAGRGSGGSWFSSRPAMAFGAGGVLAVIAMIYALVAVKPNADAMGKVQATIAARGGPPTPDEGQAIATYQGRIVGRTKMITILVSTTALPMSVARYL